MCVCVCVCVCGCGCGRVRGKEGVIKERVKRGKGWMLGLRGKVLVSRRERGRRGVEELGMK